MEYAQPEHRQVNIYRIKRNKERTGLHTKSLQQRGPLQETLEDLASGDVTQISMFNLPSKAKPSFLFQNKEIIQVVKYPP